MPMQRWWFQSHTGTITTVIAPPSIHPSGEVSIPHRYDYDGEAGAGDRATGRFNPTQVRLRRVFGGVVNR